MGLIVLFLVTQSGTLLHRALETRWLVWVGRVSYGLYLWHAPIASKIGWWRAPEPVRMASTLAIALLVAAASYRWIEKPFLRRKAKHQGAVPIAAKAA